MGWNVTVCRQEDGGSSAATRESKTGVRIAVWQTHPWGLRWFLDLLHANEGVELGGNGYPDLFTVKAKYLVPQILYGPPEANDVWFLSEGDVVVDGWVGKTIVDRVATARCDPDEWLLIVVWDES